MAESIVGCVWLSYGDGRQAINFMCLCRNHLLVISNSKVMSTDSCSQVPLPFCSIGNTCPFKRSFCFFNGSFFNNEPGLGGVRVVTIFGTNIDDAIPPCDCLETSKASICKLDMFGFFILKTVDEWSDHDGIHCHGEWNTLRYSFLGEQGFSVNKQLDVLPVEV